MSNSTNTVAVIVVGVLGFIAIVICGKWLLERHHERCYPQHRVKIQAPVNPAPAPAASTIIIQGQTYPTYPQYHSNESFWLGYSDGYCGRPARLGCVEYARGYEIGCRDRVRRNPYYFHRCCPPGFHLRINGFSLNVR
jgi:hypothetical protein